MTGLPEDVLFVLGILDLLLINKNIFVDPLHRVKLATVLIDHQEHLAERPFIYDLHNFEVI